MFTDRTTIKKWYKLLKTKKPKNLINKILYKYFKLGNGEYKKLLK